MHVISYEHWCRFVKNIVGQPKYWEERVAVIDEIINVSQLLGACAQAPHNSLHPWS